MQQHDSALGSLNTQEQVPRSAAQWHRGGATAGERRRRSMVVEVPAEAKQVAVVRRIVQFVLADHRRRDDVALAVSELLTNACLHGSASMEAPVRVRVVRLPFGLVYVSVTDRGRSGVEPPAVSRPGKDEDAGLGLLVVDRLAWRRWQRRRARGGHRVHVVFVRRGPR